MKQGRNNNCHVIITRFLAQIISIVYYKKDRHYFRISQSAERRVCVAINYRSAMQPSYLGCRFRTDSALRMCGFDISQTFRQTGNMYFVYMCMHANVHKCVSMCLYRGKWHLHGFPFALRPAFLFIVPETV